MIETKVTWRSKESIADIEAALREYGRAEIGLLPEYHHALWRNLGEDGPGRPEVLDVAGGLELLERIARIDNLAGLGLLAERLKDFTIEVRVVSPSPVVHVYLQNGKPGAAAGRTGA